MAAIDEAREQLIAAFQAWDFSPAYPVGFTGTKAPVVVVGNPTDIIPNIIQYLRDQMTGAILSIESTDVSDNFRTLGDHYGPGAGGLQRYGTRVELVFTCAVWADQQAGGPDLCQKLAGQVQGCCFYNRNRLAAYRTLKSRGGHETYEDRPNLWRHDVVVSGSGIASFDA